MTDNDFQQHVIENLSALRTAMTYLVGPDGQSGRMAKVERDVAILKSERDQGLGATRLRKVIWAAAVSVLAAVSSFAAEIIHLRRHS